MTSQIVTKSKRRCAELPIHPPMCVGVEDTELRSHLEMASSPVRQAEMGGLGPVLLSPHLSRARGGQIVAKKRPPIYKAPTWLVLGPRSPSPRFLFPQRAETTGQHKRDVSVHRWTDLTPRRRHFTLPLPVQHARFC